MCVAKPVSVELRCHATALILVIGKAQFRRAKYAVMRQLLLKKVILFFLNYLPLKIWTLKCSFNSLTLQYCRYDVFALPTPVLNLAIFMYKHLLGA